MAKHHHLPAEVSLKMHFSDDAQYYDLLNLVPSPIAYISRDLTHKFVNTAYADLVDMDISDIPGKEITFVLGMGLHFKMRAYIDQVLSGQDVRFKLEHSRLGKTGLFEVALNPDLTEANEVMGFSVLISNSIDKVAVPDDNGNLLEHKHYYQDQERHQKNLSFANNEISERTEDLLRNIEELRRSEERYHRMVSEVEDYAIILLDKDGNIENWNKGAERIKRYTAEEALGKNFRIFYTKEDQTKRLPEVLLNEAAKHGKALHEGWRIRKDDTVFWGSIVITALYDDNADIIGFSKVTRDLTERKANEEALLKKNIELEKKNQELSTFAYVSSHDLQEPLRKIQAFTSRILEIEAENLTERGHDYFNRLQAAVVRMRTLIQDLLLYSGIDESERKFVSTDLNLLVAEVHQDVNELLESKNGTLVYNALPTVNVIPFQFVQLMSNLIANAIKFSKKDVAPHIEIKAEVLQGQQIQHLVADENKSYHHITVSDNGIGFSPQYSLKIFEVFQRLHHKKDYPGTGVGLAICRKIVDSHAGIITAEGRENEGATFHIYLPV